VITALDDWIPGSRPSAFGRCLAPERRIQTLESERYDGVCPRTAFWSKEGRPNFVFAFHDREEIGPKMLARIARHTGLRAEDL
jgi:hypothetical protein